MNIKGLIRPGFSILLMLTLVIGMILTACGAKDGADDGEAEQASAAQAAAEHGEDYGIAGYRATVIYLVSDAGQMLPVTKHIPWEEGIGRAALDCLAIGGANETEAALMGLELTIPKEASYSLRIADDGTATVDMRGMPALESAEDERNMIVSIVNTLAEFPAIERVRFTFDGEERKKLECGTDVSRALEPFALNAEEGEVTASTEGTSGLTLFFPNASASLVIPVTRYINGADTFETAVRELIAGPKDDSLCNCFPAGTKLLSASLVDGVATVDLSREFFDETYTEGLTDAAYEALLATARESYSAARLELYVEGEAWQPLEGVSGYTNEMRAD